ncbi:hypothetical protein ACLOJK_032935 [Asimina triloba]
MTSLQSFRSSFDILHLFLCYFLTLGSCNQSKTKEIVHTQMEAFLPLKPSIQRLRCRPKLGPGGGGSRVYVTVKAINRRPHGQYYGGDSVDESMIILRKRMYELKLSEESFGMGEQEQQPDHEDWMEWEKRYKTSSAYDSDVCEALGLLQTMLMNTRPGLAIGMVGFVLLSVTAFVGMILISLAHAANGFLHGL